MKKFGTVAILAGGKSSRMGFDKQLIELNGENIVKRNTDKLISIFDEIIVVTNNQDFYKDKKYIKTIKDIIFQKGPLSGIHSALKISKSQYVYFLACDMPEIDLRFIEFMKSKIKNNDIEICIPSIKGKVEPFNGFYSKKLITRIEKLLESDILAIRELIVRSKHLIIDVEKQTDNNIFLNLNTQEDLQNYEFKKK